MCTRVCMFRIGFEVYKSSNVLDYYLLTNLYSLYAAKDSGITIT